MGREGILRRGGGVALGGTVGIIGRDGGPLICAAACGSMCDMEAFGLGDGLGMGADITTGPDLLTANMNTPKIRFSENDTMSGAIRRRT